MELVMILKIAEVQREDLRHLYCTDPRLKQEVAEATRPGKYAGHAATPRIDRNVVDPKSFNRPRPAA
jgi:hypothetical protein